MYTVDIFRYFLIVKQGILREITREKSAHLSTASIIRLSAQTS